jgi:hypothetical protein
MIRGVLFDFFGTLVEYSPSRRSQGYEKTHGILKARKIAMSVEFLVEDVIAKTYNGGARSCCVVLLTRLTPAEEETHHENH